MRWCRPGGGGAPRPLRLHRDETRTAQSASELAVGRRGATQSPLVGSAPLALASRSPKAGVTLQDGVRRP